MNETPKHRSDVTEEGPIFLAQHWPVLNPANVINRMGGEHSPPRWVRLANGDLIYGVYPQADGYEAVEGTVQEDYETSVRNSTLMVMIADVEDVIDAYEGKHRADAATDGAVLLDAAKVQRDAQRLAESVLKDHLPSQYAGGYWCGLHAATFPCSVAQQALDVLGLSAEEML